MLTAERLRELVAYDPETGAFTWRVRLGSRALAGTPAGSLTGCGYWCIRIDKKLYQAHRLAWLYVHGCWPTQDIDHRDGDRLNNRLDNLRDVPNEINRQNMRGPRADNQSRLLGVSFDRRRGQYFSRIRTAGVQRHLGYFGTDAQAAHEAYVQAKRAQHVGCTI